VCRLVIHGGKRCAGHTRVPALETLLQTTYPLNQRDTRKVIDFASTVAGQRELTDLRDETPDFDKKAFLTAMLRQGRVVMAAQKETAAVLKALPVPPVSNPDPPRVVPEKVFDLPTQPVLTSSGNPEWLYRAVSKDEWKQIQKTGYIQSDGRMNLADDEGTCFSARDPKWYLPTGAGEYGRIIRVHPSGEITKDPRDGYWKTLNKVPTAAIDAVTPPYISGVPAESYNPRALTRDAVREIENAVNSLPNDQYDTHRPVYDFSNNVLTPKRRELVKAKWDEEENHVTLTVRESDMIFGELSTAANATKDERIITIVNEVINKVGTVRREQKERENLTKYRGHHAAPTTLGPDAAGVTMDNMNEVMPDYLKRPKLYDFDKESLTQALRVSGNPDAEVTIYRAVPVNVTGAIANGDWVTTSRAYAEQHGESNLTPAEGYDLGGNEGVHYKIVTAVVPAGNVATNGDSAKEYGYQGETITKN
jgi:hypothetical protein